MSITTYATLQSTVADVLNRSDLTDAIKTFIQSAESRLKRDRRARKQQDRTLSVSADPTDLPTDFQAIDSLAHDGPTYYGPIQILSVAELANIKGQTMTTGVPRYAAVIDGAGTTPPRLRFGPPPNATYSLHLVYYLKITPLSDSNTTNWLLLDNPDVYLYATLLESAPYLKDDERMAIWRTEYDARMEELHNAQWNAQWSGQSRQQFKAIG